MSQSSYENYAVGPFDAFYSSQQRLGSNNASEPGRQYSGQKVKDHCRSQVSADINVDMNVDMDRNTVTARQSQILARLEKLSVEEQRYIKMIEKACRDIEAACRIVNNNKNLIEERQKLLTEQTSALNELYDYGRSIKRKLGIIREKIGEARQEMTESDQQKKKIFTSQAESETGRTKAIARALSPDYTPQASVMELLTQFHQIPAAYINEQLLEFRIYYTDTQESRPSWDRCFYKWVDNNWKREKNNQGITADFQPASNILSELSAEGIAADFCEQERPGFILYWQEQEARFTPRLWQERYMQWIRRAWRRYQANEGHTRPSRPTTEELTDTSWVGKYQFNFDEDE